MALDHMRVPAYNPTVAELGSFRFFQDHIRADPRFELIEQVDFLFVLRRKVPTGGLGR